MQKLMIAVTVTAGLGVLPVSAAVAADVQGKHHHSRHHVWVSPSAWGPYVNPDAVRDGYVMNGNFDWRRIGEKRPWYAHGYNNDCVAWTQNAYHYACDPNNRY
jgi:hypothetical protein